MSLKRIVATGFILLAYAGTASAWDLGKLGKRSFQLLTEKVYVMHGPLGEPNAENQGFMNNPGFIETAKGLVIIDPGSTLHVGQKVLEEIRKVSGKPVLAVFNTHIHGDHWLGNQAVLAAYPEAKIYAHPKMISRAKGGDGQTWVDLMKRLIGEAAKGTDFTVPGHAVKAGDVIKVDDQTFKIHGVERAHTNTDIMIEHVESKTIFLGDNGFIHRLGQFEESGEMHGNIDALEMVKKGGFTHFVPGHGPSGDAKTSLKPFLDYMKAIQAGVQKGYESDKQDFQIRKEIAASFKGYEGWAGFKDYFGKHVSKMYQEVEERSF